MSSRTSLTRRDLGRRLFRAAAPAMSTAQDIAPERRLLNRAAFGPSPQDAAHIAAVGWPAWIEEQIDWPSIDDSAVEALLASQSFGNAAIELIASFVTRCLQSRRQLQMRMTAFWENHFNTDLQSTVAVSELEEEAAFRQNALGPFATLLVTSAKSPAMIDYLNSNTNIAAQPNENYARELMELHTVGVGGGYTENDVAEAARIFTGWGRRRISDPVTNEVVATLFVFRPGQHDTGPKSISLGFSTPGISGPAGVQEGEQFLRFLAALPQTQARIAGKLCTYFIADEPPAGVVSRVTQELGKPGATIADALRIILGHVAGELSFQPAPAFGRAIDPAALGRDKTMDGFEYMMSTLRRLDPTIGNLRPIINRIDALGNPLFRFPVPTGLPEVGPAWSGAGNLIGRLTTAHEITTGSFPGLSIDPLSVIGTPVPTTVSDAVDRLLDRLVDGAATDTTRAMLEGFLASRITGMLPIQQEIVQSTPDLAGLILRLPEANQN